MGNVYLGRLDCNLGEVVARFSSPHAANSTDILPVLERPLGRARLVGKFPEVQGCRKREGSCDQFEVPSSVRVNGSSVALV